MRTGYGNGPWQVGVIVSIVVALLGSPLIYRWLTSEAAPPPGNTTEPRGLSMDNWAGDWICTAEDSQLNLTINGRGRDSSLKGYYPVAYGDRPATEDYIIRSVAGSVSGEYIYYDSSPNIGYRGRAGVWNGEWSITFRQGNMSLTRQDRTTPWVGWYQCVRK